MLKIIELTYHRRFKKVLSMHSQCEKRSFLLINVIDLILCLSLAFC